MSLHDLHGLVAYDRTRLEMAEHRSEGARRRLARLASPTSRWQAHVDDDPTSGRTRLRLRWRHATR